MSDGKEHILLLGDTHEAAKWVGFGKARLRLLRATNQLARNYKPKSDVLVRIERWGGVEKVIIRVQPPPGPAFVGLPYDTFSFDGYGFDPDREADHVIGTAHVDLNRATLVKTGIDGAWFVERYPHYVGDYGGEPEYGNNVWRSNPSPAATTLSWKGLQSRHPQVLLANQELYAGFNCQDSGFAYIGMQLTDGLFCSGPSQNWNKTIPYTSVSLPDGSTNEIDGGNVLIDLFGQYVYKDGKRFFNAGSNQTVMGAAVRTINEDSTFLEPERQFLCVIAERDRSIGIYKEYLYYAPANDITSGKKVLIAEYGNDRYSVTATPYFVRPETNGMSWIFSESGNFAVTMRQFYTDQPGNDDYFEVVAVRLDPDEVIAGGEIEYELEQLWNSQFNGPRYNSTADTLDFKGEYVATVDVDGEEIVYAYIDVDFHREAVLDGTTLTSKTTNTETLRFSKFPEDTILLHQIDFETRWYPDDSGRTYCYKDAFSAINKIQALGCIDARYGVLTTWEQNTSPHREHTKGNITTALTFECIPYPVPVTEQVKTYVGGKLIDERPVVVWNDYNFFINLSEITCPDSVNLIIYAYNPFLTTDGAAHPYMLNQFGCYASSAVAARIDDQTVDMVLSYKAYNNGFDSTNLLLRIDRTTGAVKLQRDLDEVLQIGEYNPYLPFLETKLDVIEGTYGYVGLI